MSHRRILKLTMKFILLYSPFTQLVFSR